MKSSVNLQTTPKNITFSLQNGSGIKQAEIFNSHKKLFFIKFTVFHWLFGALCCCPHLSCKQHIKFYYEIPQHLQIPSRNIPIDKVSRLYQYCETRWSTTEAVFSPTSLSGVETPKLKCGNKQKKNFSYYNHSCFCQAFLFFFSFSAVVLTHLEGTKWFLVLTHHHLTNLFVLEHKSWRRREKAPSWDMMFRLFLLLTFW